MNKKLLLSFVFLLALVFRVAAQDRTITGKVTSAEDGSALPGVSVGVKGSTKGTVSAADGSYKINASGNATLTFTFVGFKKADVPVGTKSIINVSLSSDVSDLEEVVVVGYGGTQARRTLTGSQASVKGSDIANVPVQTFDRALQGRAAGVQISGSNGVPGGQVQVRIRGVGSIKGGTDPLYVVDGVQINTTSSSVYASTNPLSYLNPNDIENIEILKDAASAAIYGAAAANGVVLVTTKKGKAGKTSITLDYNTGYVEPTKYLDVLNTQEWIKLRTEAIMNQTGSTEAAARSSALTGVRLSGTLSDAEIAALPTYDWQKEAYQSGTTNNYNFSMNGGNDKTTFFLSGAYNQSDANVRNIDYKGGNFSAKLNNKVSSHLSVDASINLSSFNQRGTFGGPNGGSFLGSPSFSSPLILPMNRIFNDDGSYFGTPAEGGIAGVLNQNVLMVSDLNKINSRTNQLITSLGLTYKIIDGLTFRPYASLDYRTINGYNFQDPRTADAFNVKGRIASQQFELINFLTNATVMYDKVIKNDHKIGALVGVEYRQNTQENYQATAEGIPTPQFTTQSSAANPISVFSSWTGFKKAGVFTRLSYDYKDKYFLGLTARYDGSSRFGSDNLYGFFPGVSAGWDISGEDFLKNNPSVSQLKLRASYGTLGNDQIGNFDSRGLYGGGANYNGLSGISPSSLSNASLRWERNTTSNFGLDYGFFNSRVQGSIEYFVRTSSDLLLDQPVPQTSGFSTISNNLGELQNKGLEFSIKTINIDRGGFKWTTDFNITKINNKITKLYDTLTTLPGRAVDEQIKIGQPLNSIYVAQYAGVNPATGRAMWYDNAGNIIYRLAGSVDSYSKIIGSQIPNLYGGFTNDFSYKGFDLNVLFTYEYGRTAFNNQSSFMFENGGRTFNTLRSVYESRWTTPGQITSTPRPINGNAETLGSGITSSLGSRVYEDASYIRLKTISLGYNIPKSALSKFGLGSARVYLQAYNLYTWTKWSGFDAEWTNLGSGNTGIVPQPRVVTAGVKLGF